MYLTGFAMKDAIDAAGIPQSTWRFAVVFDDPADTSVSRTGYATKLDKPIISRSPYIQNCSILSFLGGNGILVDGAKVQSPNTPIIKEEVELNADNVQPEQGKSMVAAYVTMVSFGGIGWRVINDGYSQVVSVSRSSVDMVHLHSLVVTYPSPTLQPTSDSTSKGDRILQKLFRFR